MEHKADLVHETTAGRTESSRELSLDEANALISKLKTMLPPREYHTPEARMRRKIIGIFRQMGWEKPGQHGKPKADMKRIYAWVKRYGTQAPQGLNDYTSEELVGLVTQVQILKKKWIAQNRENLKTA